MNEIIKNSWEKRSKIFGASKKAVMSQAYPPFLSEYIHKIHLREISDVLPNKKYLCLDVGCGYGRIAEETILRRPNVFIQGIDIAPSFVRLFNQQLKGKGKAVEADVRSLPFEDKTFDFIWVVMTLIYLHKEDDRKKAIREIFRVLKPGGRVVMIELSEPGYNLINLWGFLPFIYRTILRRKKIETFETPLPLGEIESSVEIAGGRIMRKKGYPFLTLFLVWLLLLDKIFPPLLAPFLDIIRKLDNKFPSPRFSYFITYMGEKL